MTSQPVDAILWFLGLSPEDRRLVREAAGDGYDCRALDDLDSEELASILKRGDADDPLLLWLDGRTWLTLRRERPDILQHIELVPSVLVLDAHCPRESLELAVDAHFQQVIRRPLERAQVFDALSRAREGHNMFMDMTRMAREIMMGRELLERKADVCSFLFQTFAGISHAPDARALLTECGRAMRTAFPLDGLHAVWWGGGQNVFMLEAPAGGAHAEAWSAFLRKQAFLSEAQTWLTDGAADIVLYGEKQGGLPEPGKILMLPLDIRGKQYGALALHLPQSLLSGRDMALALDAVRRYLALALWERNGDREFFAAAPATPIPSPVPVRPEEGSGQRTRTAM